MRNQVLCKFSVCVKAFGAAVQNRCTSGDYHHLSTAALLTVSNRVMDHKKAKAA